MKNKFLIKKIFLPFHLASLLMFCNLVLADYVSPPDWSGSPFYTHQSWDFNETGKDEKGKSLPPKEPFLPDGKPPMVNAHGRPRYTFYADKKEYFDWAYIPMNMKDWKRNGMWGCMAPGVPAGLLFHIPNHKSSKLKTELWLQYVISQYRGAEFKAAVYDGNNTPFIMISRDKKEIASGGGSGTWYRITEMWETSLSPQTVQVKIEFSKNMCLIEQVHIDTRCISAARKAD
ncbi:MAG: hypothetical protein HGJ97_19320 [Desulfosporosinus sp.]|nr:hypothetical protein [Desulfosporosinus sp.]